MNKNFSIKRVIVLLSVIILVLVIIKLTYKTDEDQSTQELPTPTLNQVIENDDFVYSDQWTKAEFPIEYNVPIGFMIPPRWKLNCCLDTGDFSNHVITPEKSKGKIGIGPEIDVYDFVLSICKNGSHNDCTEDETKSVNVATYINSLTKYLSNGGGLAGMTSIKKEGLFKLKNFSKNVVRYSGKSFSNQPEELYIIQTENDVVGIVFRQEQTFDKSFKNDFLERILPI